MVKETRVAWCPSCYGFVDLLTEADTCPWCGEQVEFKKGENRKCEVITEMRWCRSGLPTAGK